MAAGASVRIVDPSGALLRRWSTRARKVAMAWMRSPANAHLDAKPSSLFHFVGRPENADVASLAGPFRRPTYEAFMRHSDHVVERQRLHELLVGGRVECIRPDASHLLVLGEGVELRARRVLLATGHGRLRTPRWARDLRRAGAPIRHVFEEEGSADREVESSHDLVGGGTSAVQRALLLQRRTRRTVRLWMRSPLRVDEFDFDRDWSKHRFMAAWAKLPDRQRFAFLERNPSGGSVPSGLAARLRRAVERGWIEIVHGVPRVEWDARAGRVVLSGDARTQEASGVTLVTGFEPETLPSWLRATSESLDLPSVRGIPRLGRDMEWGRGIHLIGPLARLRLGPVAGLLVGARWGTSLLPGVRMQPV